MTHFPHKKPVFTNMITCVTSDPNALWGNSWLQSGGSEDLRFRTGKVGYTIKEQKLTCKLTGAVHPPNQTCLVSMYL